MSTTSFYVQRATPMTLAAGSLGWWMDFPDPSDWIAPLFSKASAAEGGMNSSFWWSPKVEKMFAEAQKLTDPVARIANYSEMQDLHLEVGPVRALLPADPDDDVLGDDRGFYLHPVYQIDPTQYWKE